MKVTQIIQDTRSPNLLQLFCKQSLFASFQKKQRQYEVQQQAQRWELKTKCNLLKGYHSVTKKLSLALTFSGLFSLRKRDLIRQLEAEHLRLLKLLQPSAFHINPGLYDTTHGMVNASAQS